MRRVRVLFVMTHPIQYASPLFCRYSNDPRLEITVAYCSLLGAEVAFDEEFGVEFSWDVALLEGYRWIAPRNLALRPRLNRFFGLFNPSLWRMISQGRFDVVVCNGYRTLSFWIAAMASRYSRAALVWITDAHSMEARSGNPVARSIRVRVKRHVVPLILRSADAVFVPSMRSHSFMRSLGLKESRVFLIPYAVDTEFFESEARRSNSSALREQLGIPAGAFVVLFVGKLVPWKRPQDLVDALPREDRVHAVFAGDGQLRSDLEARVRSLGLDRQVHFLGFVNQRDLPSLYAAADVLVLPSEYETFGLVVSEAFSCGTPAIVSSTCGAAGDLVRDAESGFVYQVRETGALAARLRELANDDDLVRQLADGARRIIAGWSPARNTEALATACAALAGGSGR